MATLFLLTFIHLFYREIKGESVWVRAHVDLVSTGFDDEHRIQEVIENKIFTSRRIGQLVVQNLNFQRFGGEKIIYLFVQVN